MAKAQNSSPQSNDLPGFLGNSPASWQEQIEAVAERFNQEYRGDAFELPEEVEAMPIFREWAGSGLAGRIASPFWQMTKLRKGQRCLDIGCGVSFLIYPWRDWDAVFYGQDISTVARDQLNARGPQLNSKLFKGVKLGPAHRLDYEADQFDLAIATGFSCYYSLDYWQLVMAQVKRVLKPEGEFVFDVIDPDSPLAENWAILETYLGTEVFLEPLSAWQELIKSMGAKVVKKQAGELFQQYKVRF